MAVPVRNDSTQANSAAPDFHLNSHTHTSTLPPPLPNVPHSLLCRRPGWDLRCVIVKTGDDCRQELLAMQLIRAFSEIFAEAQLPLWLRTYQVGLPPCVQLPGSFCNGRVQLGHGRYRVAARSAQQRQGDAPARVPAVHSA